jgi:general secretion pathway protein I
MLRRGFTLVEVMLALAILAMGLAVLIKSTASNIASTEGAHMDGVVAQLARAQMYEIEEKLAKEGFQDTDDHKEGSFEEQGWPSVTWDYKVEAVELPDLGAVQNMAQKEMQGSRSGTGSGSGSGSNDAMGMFGNSALGGMLGMFGGMGGLGGGSGSGMTGADAKGAAFIQGQYEMVKQVLKASIRKITLTVKWTVVQEERSMEVVEYVTDAAGMNKVLGGLGATPSDTQTQPPPSTTPPTRTTPR